MQVHFGYLISLTNMDKVKIYFSIFLCTFYIYYLDSSCFTICTISGFFRALLIIFCDLVLILVGYRIACNIKIQENTIKEMYFDNFQIP